MAEPITEAVVEEVGRDTRLPLNTLIAYFLWAIVLWMCGEVGLTGLVRPMLVDDSPAPFTPIGMFA